MRLLFVFLMIPVLAHAERYAIHAGQAYTMTVPGPSKNVTILVSDGRVESIGAGIEVPPGYEEIDARDLVVTPGLVAPYTQLGLQEIELEKSTRDDFVEDYPLGPALDVADAFNEASTLYAVNRRDGVTRAVVAPKAGADPLAGWAGLMSLREPARLLDTRVAMFGNLGAEEYTGGSRAAVIQRLKEGLYSARRLNRQQNDVREYRRADLEALNALLKSSAPLVLEAHRASDIRRAIELAEDFELRLVILGGSEAWRVAEELAAHDVPVIVDALANLPQRFDRLGARGDNAALLHAAGVTVSLRSEETQNARWMRQAAGNAVADGMPWEAALAAITRNPALTFGFPPGTGQIAVGGVADLVLWTGDPLEVTTWAQKVMIDGQWQPMESRQTRLFERYRQVGDDVEPFGYR